MRASLPALRRTHGGGGGSPLIASIAAGRHRTAASRSLNELARAVVRGMLGLKCRQAVMQEEPRSRAFGEQHTAAAAQLICRRRSFQQLGAGADDPHTQRNEAVLHM